MQTLYDTLIKGNVGIIESPTGTGKTLSLLCGSLSWLKSVSILPDDFVREKPQQNPKPKSDISDLPSWLLEISDDEIALNEKRENQRFQLEQLKKRLKQRMNRKVQIFHELGAVEQALPQKRTRVTEDEDLLFDSISFTESDKEEIPISVTKIYYCSRTHSQLSQVLQEFLNLSWANDVRCTIIGGRRTFCINPSVRRFPTDAQMSDECLFLQRNRARGKSGCSYHNREKEEAISDELLMANKDIEDIMKYANEEIGCPYYATRKAIPFLQLVLSPYNLILNRKSREALGIDLKNQVVIFDEAHNLINAISDIFSPTISYTMLTTSCNQIDAYYKRYSSRLSSQSHSFIIHLQTVMNAFTNLLSTKPADFGVTNIFTPDRLIHRLHLESINFFDIIHFVTAKRIVQKLNGFVDTLGEDGKPSVSFFPVVMDFILSLTNDNDDARVVVSYDKEKEPFIKFILLNPGVHFKEIVNDCRAVIITGGTLPPISELQAQLFPHLPADRITSLCLPHILPADHVRALYVTNTSSQQEMRFDYTNRNNPGLLSDLLDKILLLCKTVPRGLVVFLPSFAMLQTVIRHMHANNQFALLNQYKRVFTEERDKDIFAGYSSYLKENVTKGALLFAVIGGKLSEGINFSDDLGRCVAIVGMPYPNKTDVVLQEKMSYLNQQKPGSGQTYYINLCMQAVNQAIGRAFRHKDDWACVVFFDCRYSANETRNRLTRWIDNRGIVCNDMHTFTHELEVFYRHFTYCV